MATEKLTQNPRFPVNLRNHHRVFICDEALMKYEGIFRMDLEQLTANPPQNSVGFNLIENFLNNGV